MDKKSDDYVVRMPAGNYGGKDKPTVNFPPRGSQDTEAMSKLENNPQVAITAYCLASISMTVVNKYVVSGSSWDLTFFYLAVQVCFSLAYDFLKGLTPFLVLCLHPYYYCVQVFWPHSLTCTFRPPEG